MYDVFVCVCVCVCLKERERERERAYLRARLVEAGMRLAAESEAVRLRRTHGEETWRSLGEFLVLSRRQIGYSAVSRRRGLRRCPLITEDGL